MAKYDSIKTAKCALNTPLIRTEEKKKKNPVKIGDNNLNSSHNTHIYNEAHVYRVGVGGN